MMWQLMFPKHRTHLWWWWRTANRGTIRRMTIWSRPCCFPRSWSSGRPRWRGSGTTGCVPALPSSTRPRNTRCSTPCPRCGLLCQCGWPAPGRWRPTRYRVRPRWRWTWTRQRSCSRPPNIWCRCCWTGTLWTAAGSPCTVASTSFSACCSTAGRSVSVPCRGHHQPRSIPIRTTATAAVAEATRGSSSARTPDPTPIKIYVRQNLRTTDTRPSAIRRVDKMRKRVAKKKKSPRSTGVRYGRFRFVTRITRHTSRATRYFVITRVVPLPRALLRYHATHDYRLSTYGYVCVLVNG